MIKNASKQKPEDYILDENSELNLLKMYRETIKEAFKRHDSERVDFIAFKLGISSKSLYRFVDMFGFRGLIEENRLRRQILSKEKHSAKRRRNRAVDRRERAEQ